MPRLFAICLFATAAAAATAAGSGVVVAPHIDPPGTPLFHTHTPALYRLPLFVHITPSVRATRTIVDEEEVFDATATLVLAVLALAAAYVARPTLRVIAELAPIAFPGAQLYLLRLHGPPRAALHV